MDDVKGPDTSKEFECLVQTYQTQMRRLCCMILKDTHLAEDAVQETFLKAYLGMNGFRQESSEKTWLTRIAVNTCRDLMRSRWFRHIDLSVDIAYLPEEASKSDPEDMALMDLVLRLPLKQREVVLLYYYQNMKTEEIADALGIAVSSVSERLKRAREKLRTALKGVYFNE